jgi:hypothetical protein
MKPTIEINEENFEIEVWKLTPQPPCLLNSVPRAMLMVVLSEHRPETGSKPTVESTRGGRRLPQLQRGC